MMWFVLVLCAFVAGTRTQSVPNDEPIPYSGGRGQIFTSSDDLIKSFRRQQPISPESPAVVPIGSNLPGRIPTTELKAPLKPSRLSHLHPRSARDAPIVTEQNSTSQSVGSESPLKSNLSESTGQSHQVPSEEYSKAKSFPASPSVFILPVQVREIFPDLNSQSDSEPLTNLGRSVQLPRHVKEVPEEDSSLSFTTELAPQGQFVLQLSEDVLPPFVDAPLILIPLTQVSFDQSLQQYANNPQIPTEQNTRLKSISELAQQISGQSQQLPEQVSNGPQNTLSSNVTEKAQQNSGQSHQLSEQVSNGQRDALSSNVSMPAQQNSRQSQQISKQVLNGQQDTLSSNVTEKAEQNSGQSQQLSEQVSNGQRDTLSSNISKSAQQNSGHSQQLPEQDSNGRQDTLSSFVLEPAQQNSGQSQQLSEQVSNQQEIETLSPKISEAPPRPNFDRSLHLRDDLSVPRSGYTEAYEIVWHRESNTARTAIENSTVIYRKLLLDGRIQYLEVKTGRTNGSEIRHCTMSPPLVPTSTADITFPGLPAMGPFQFVGYTTEEGRSQVEHWQYVMFRRPGEGGAAQGESFNVTHDFFAFREGSDAVPLRYTVTTDSSVLGAASDTYTHRYRLLPAPTTAILPDTTRECDVFEQLMEDATRRRSISGTVVG